MGRSYCCLQRVYLTRESDHTRHTQRTTNESENAGYRNNFHCRKTGIKLKDITRHFGQISSISACTVSGKPSKPSKEEIFKTTINSKLGRQYCLQKVLKMSKISSCLTLDSISHAPIPQLTTCVPSSAVYLQMASRLPSVQRTALRMGVRSFPVSSHDIVAHCSPCKLHYTSEECPPPPKSESPRSFQVSKP